MTQIPTSRWARWNDRLKIVALGLTLGIAARWVTRTWQATAATSPPSAAESLEKSAHKSER